MDQIFKEKFIKKYQITLTQGQSLYFLNELILHIFFNYILQHYLNLYCEISFYKLHNAKSKAIYMQLNLKKSKKKYFILIKTKISISIIQISL